MADGPLQRYRAMVRQGALSPDSNQALAAEKLESLHHAVAGYRPEEAERGWLQRFGLGRRREAVPPQGLYLYGPVGRGKSMLMDLFFETAPVERKRRVHFHAFMAEVHDRLHRHRKAARDNGGGEPIQPVARAIAEDAWLLCFDEFDVSDIADAMILGRLFEALFAQGVVVVATSNKPPDDLYKGGLQRERFLPFIEMIRQRLDILALDGGSDYRRQRIRGMQVYYQDDEAALADAFARLTEGAAPGPETVAVKGRRVPVPAAARGVAWFRFDDLCRAALGAGDYLAIAASYHTVFVSGIPKMDAADRNAARRFIHLVDALYENKVTLVAAAAAPPDELYRAGDGADIFQRTASRLFEMQSADYLAAAHGG